MSHETITDGVAAGDPTTPGHKYSEAARRNLWLQMSRMGSYNEHNEVPIIVSGDGVHVYDANGKKYFDGLSGLYTNALGHGRTDIAKVAAEQMSTLAYFPLWTYAHPQAVALAEKLASLTPGNLNSCLLYTSPSPRD